MSWKQANGRTAALVASLAFVVATALAVVTPAIFNTAQVDNDRPGSTASDAELSGFFVAQSQTEQPLIFQAPEAALETPTPETNRTESPTAAETPAVNTMVPPAATQGASAATLSDTASSFGRDQARAWLVEAGWPAHVLEAALNVVSCESGYIPTKHNGVDAGLFQISTASNATLKGSWFQHFDVDGSRWAEPVFNARVALWIWEGSGFGPWSCKP